MENQASIITRILAIAATATASSLMSDARYSRRRDSNTSESDTSRLSNSNTISSGSSLFSSTPANVERNGTNSTSGETGENREESSFDQFLTELRTGLLAAQLSNSIQNQTNNSNNRRETNYVRVFRFGSGESNEEGVSMVPVLIVSVQSADQNSDGEGASLFGDNATATNEPSQPSDPFNMQNEWRRFRRRRSNSTASETNTETRDTERGTESEEQSAPSRQYWVVYVAGGAYPSNHPILLRPSILSGNPTYEDLLDLGAFMGQVKPPVATAQEIEQSGGIFTYVEEKVVSKDTGSNTDEKEIHERCLICLTDYENGDQCRKLQNCSHAFHKECIDQWLTTGRNTCPMCRAEGVKKMDDNDSSTNSSTTASATA